MKDATSASRPARSSAGSRKRAQGRREAGQLAHAARHHHDPAAPRDQREQRLRHANGAEVVDVQRGRHAIGVEPVQRHPRVVDQRMNRRALGLESRRERRDRRCVAHVERPRLDRSRAARAETGGGRLRPSEVAPREDDPQAPTRELPAGLEPDAPVAARHHRAFTSLHGRTIAAEAPAALAAGRERAAAEPSTDFRHRRYSGLR